jgi:hypothetical protein
MILYALYYVTIVEPWFISALLSISALAFVVGALPWKYILAGARRSEDPSDQVLSGELGEDRR